MVTGELSILKNDLFYFYCVPRSDRS
jgi:hypothetical protein